MKVLVIGGSRFVGRHIVEQLLKAGHEITVFNRGISSSREFPGIVKITGDRENPRDLEQLQGREWDAVVDTCGYVPRSVARMAELLEGRIGHYVNISTCSVYKDWIYKDYIDESSEIARLAPDEEAKWLAGTGDESRSREWYGELKALCEQEIDKRNYSAVTHVRPCVIAGPYDPTDRFTYWVQRISQGGAVLAPLPKEGKVQYIDARDLAEWIVSLINTGTAGTFNACGPGYTLTMEQLLQQCAAALGTSPELIWKDSDCLIRHQVQPWSDLPFWLPEAGSSISNAKALANGLIIRDIRETILDTHHWASEEWEKRPQAAGLTRQRENELLSGGLAE